MRASQLSGPFRCDAEAERDGQRSSTSSSVPSRGQPIAAPSPSTRPQTDRRLPVCSTPTTPAARPLTRHNRASWGSVARKSSTAPSAAITCRGGSPSSLAAAPAASCRRARRRPPRPRGSSLLCPRTIHKDAARALRLVDDIADREGRIALCGGGARHPGEQALWLAVLHRRMRQPVLRLAAAQAPLRRRARPASHCRSAPFTARGPSGAVPLPPPPVVRRRTRRLAVPTSESARLLRPADTQRVATRGRRHHLLLQRLGRSGARAPACAPAAGLLRSPSALSDSARSPPARPRTARSGTPARGRIRVCQLEQPLDRRRPLRRLPSALSLEPSRHSLSASRRHNPAAPGTASPVPKRLRTVGRPLPRGGSGPRF